MTRLEVAEALLAEARAAAEADPDSLDASIAHAVAEHRVKQEKRAALPDADGLAAPEPSWDTPEPGGAL